MTFLKYFVFIFMKREKNEVHYQSFSYPLYTATLTLDILAVKEQQCRRKGILWVCSPSYSQRVSPEDTFSVKQTIHYAP